MIEQHMAENTSSSDGEPPWSCLPHAEGAELHTQIHKTMYRTGK